MSKFDFKEFFIDVLVSLFFIFLLTLSLKLVYLEKLSYSLNQEELLNNYQENLKSFLPKDYKELSKIERALFMIEPNNNSFKQLLHQKYKTLEGDELKSINSRDKKLLEGDLDLFQALQRGESLDPVGKMKAVEFFFLQVYLIDDICLFIFISLFLLFYYIFRLILSKSTGEVRG